MDIDYVIEKLETLVLEYHEAAPKNIGEDDEGLYAEYMRDEDYFTILGMERALDLVRELKESASA